MSICQYVNLLNFSILGRAHRSRLIIVPNFNGTSGGSERTQRHRSQYQSALFYLLSHRPLRYVYMSGVRGCALSAGSSEFEAMSTLEYSRPSGHGNFLQLFLFLEYTARFDVCVLGIAPEACRRVMSLLLLYYAFYFHNVFILVGGVTQ